MLNFINYLINESISSGLHELDSEINSILRNKYKLDFNSPSFWEQCFIPKCTEFLKQIGFINPPERGRHRCTFISNNRNVVIKIPINPIGIIANKNEYETQNHPENRHAKCKLIYMEKTGVSILIMEKIDTISNYENKPSWSWDYDSNQIGLDKKKRWKAYDYGT